MIAREFYEGSSELWLEWPLLLPVGKHHDTQEIDAMEQFVARDARTLQTRQKRTEQQ